MKNVRIFFKKDNELIKDYLSIIANLLSSEDSSIVCFNSKDNESLYRSFRKKLVKLGTMSIKDKTKLELLIFRNNGNRLLKMRVNDQDILITYSQWLDKL